MAKRFEQTTGPSQRQQRVAELVRHALAEVLQRGDIQDEVLTRHVITIPEVRMSPDLRLATAYVMPLGGRDEGPVLRRSTATARPCAPRWRSASTSSSRPTCASSATRPSTKRRASRRYFAQRRCSAT